MFLVGIFVLIPVCSSFNLNLSEPYPLSAKIILGFPTGLLAMVGMASGTSCVLSKDNIKLKSNIGVLKRVLIIHREELVCHYYSSLHVGVRIAVIAKLPNSIKSFRVSVSRS